MTEQKITLTRSELKEFGSLGGQMKLIIGLFVVIIIMLAGPYVVLNSHSKDLGTLEAKGVEHDKKIDQFQTELKEVRVKIEKVNSKTKETNKVVKDIKMMLNSHITYSKEKKTSTK